MNRSPITEEELISRWLDAAGETFGEYAWAGPATWASIVSIWPTDKQLIEEVDRGDLGNWMWVKPDPFSVRILMNPFAEEGRIYLAHSGTQYLKFANL